MAKSDESAGDLGRPTIPLWVKVVVCALAVIGLLTIVKWIVSFVLGLVWVLAVIAVLVAAAYVLRAQSRRRGRDRGTDT